MKRKNWKRYPVRIFDRKTIDGMTVVTLVPTGSLMRETKWIQVQAPLVVVPPADV